EEWGADGSGGWRRSRCQMDWRTLAFGRRRRHASRSIGGRHAKKILISANLRCCDFSITQSAIQVLVHASRVAAHLQADENFDVAGIAGGFGGGNTALAQAR